MMYDFFLCIRIVCVFGKEVKMISRLYIIRNNVGIFFIINLSKIK